MSVFESLPKTFIKLSNSSVKERTAPFPIRVFISADLRFGTVPEVEIDPRITFTPEAPVSVEEQLEGCVSQGGLYTENYFISLAVQIENVVGTAFARKEAFVANISSMKPVWEHDCADCIYLGSFEKRDLYYCSQGRLPDTLITRYGQGSEYASGGELAKYDKHIWKAAVLAEHRGLGKFLDSQHTIHMRRR